MELNLALAQMNTVLGNVPCNLEKHLDYIHQAASSSADLLIFPELSLTGYVLQDLVPTVTCRPHPDDVVFHSLLDASHKLDIMVGFVEEDSRNRFFIASAYLSRGEVVHVHRKVYLPTYGLFDAALPALARWRRRVHVRFGIPRPRSARGEHHPTIRKTGFLALGG